RDPGSGALQPWARDIVRDLDSYAEISPSGTGVKVIVRGKLPCGAARGTRIEVYSQAHYFALTGLHLPGSPRAVEDRQAQLLLVQLAAAGPAAAAPDHQSSARPSGPRTATSSPACGPGTRPATTPTRRPTSPSAACWPT